MERISDRIFETEAKFVHSHFFVRQKNEQISGLLRLPIMHWNYHTVKLKFAMNLTCLQKEKTMNVFFAYYFNHLIAI